MIPKQHRLPRSIAKNIHPERTLHGVHASLSVAPLQGEGRVRVTCIVSKKVSPKAVVRNMLKRHCRAALAEMLNGRKPAAVFLRLKPGAETLPPRALKEEVQALFRRLP